MEQVLAKLVATELVIGEDKLCFKDSDIGMNSLRSGGPMSMFLFVVSKFIIQRIGLWASGKFLEYIREQVKCFTIGVSQNMIKFKHFHNVNAYYTKEDE